MPPGRLQGDNRQTTGSRIDIKYREQQDSNKKWQGTEGRQCHSVGSSRKQQGAVGNDREW